MNKIKKIIVESLKSKFKKKCNCGGDCCSTKNNALVLNESVASKTILSEGLKHHINNNKPLTENLYRRGSRDYFDLISEARSLYSRGILEFTNKEDITLLTETNLGHFGIFEGKKVPLDYPIKLNEGYDAYDEIAQSEFEMDYEQLGPGEQEWVRDEYDNQPSGRYLNESMIGIKTKANFKPLQLKGALERAGIEGFQMNRLSVTLTALKLDKKYFDDAKQIINDLGLSIMMAKESQLNENKLLKQDALSPAEYQKAKKLKGFDPKNYMWDKKQELHLIKKMSEGKLNEDRFGHPITAQGNQTYIQLQKLGKMLSGHEQKIYNNAFRNFWKIAKEHMEAEEQKINEVKVYIKDSKTRDIKMLKFKSSKEYHANSNKGL